METVSLAQLRRFVVAHQGFATRVRRGRTADPTGTLIVRAFHVKPKVRVSRALGEALEKALSRLARSVGLEPVRR